MLGFLLCRYLDVELLDCKCIFIGSHQTVFQSGCAVLHSHRYEDSYFSTFSTPLIVCLFFLAIVVGVVVPHCGFKLHLPNDLMMLSIFSCVYYLFLYFLWCKCLFKSFGHLFLNWIVFLFLSYMSYLYSLDMSRLSKDNNL